MASRKEVPPRDPPIPKTETWTTPKILNGRGRSGRFRAVGASAAVAAAALVLTNFVPSADGWRMWTNGGDEVSGDGGPGGRIGHSMVLAGNDSRVIMFGGRDNEIVRQHIPRTYEVTRQDGTLEFVSYDEKIVLECQENALENNVTFDSSASSSVSISSNGSTNSTGETCSTTVAVGLYYNDVWEYDLNCTRYADGPCEGTGWNVLHEGARHGACEYVRGTEICGVPSERWRQGAAMFDDNTMIVYGGYSQRCGDYCDDVWSFDLRDNSWMEIYPLGHFAEGEGPGKRWKFSVAYDGLSMMVFGGHRLWHGFATDNSEANSWSSFAEYPEGGYLQDLWVYTKKQLAEDEQVPTDSSAYGNWTKIAPKESCVADPGLAWEERNDISCDIRWPQGRAGHAAVWDEDRGGMWLHGGYTTFFPYISSDGAGSDYGTTALGRGGFRPYPDYPYFLSDMWFFNTSSGQWGEITATSPTQPTPRMNHMMVMVDHILVVFGGFYFNHHYDDTWFFNTTTSYWLEKSSHVHAVYPANCTDDLLYIEENNCTELLWPNDLERDQDSPWDVLPYAEQPNYYPDGEFARYYGVHTKGDIGSREALFSVGSPLPPYMATAPRQHVRRYVHAFNDTHSAVLYEWCTSVLGEPTRDTTLDGLFGRSDSPVFVSQPRRQAPGWDGCRDREDGRTDLDQGLMWEHPGHRSDAQAVYSKKHAMVLMYGGQGYSDWQTPSVNITTATSVLSDFWVLGMSECASNCSFHGDCSYGSCSCHDGFFGLDCSNASCPGDFCYYEETTHVEVCSHCCQAGWSHQDGDTYVTEDVSRSECSVTSPGESHGICDGFGTCQCAPPFIGDDCSIKDCQYNCSFNGWCSVEFPVSRCMCTPGYYGEYCQYLECLNNCSYPHGTCDSSTGVCACEMTYSPYNNTR
ncbi:conserved unknown protein [Ectocarpus siliculosus]|uniref:EGF-like domain-containing protein n=1 Tax=Ectocarpus siliculosus TaxID=2880 RepID=D8LEQ8_ECTSI|nr:conserved unknown protein [Ectocarpus siliculosus]|eukprot:CBN78621.1 conserved unknown protein [Ectocarpus siliculosus]